MTLVPFQKDNLAKDERFSASGRPSFGQPSESKPPLVQPPFVLELRSENVAANGDFTPSALVGLTSTLLESDLVRCLEAEELAVLLLVLACVTPNGAFEATPQRLAPVLGIGENAARQRLQHLATAQWQGRPVLDGERTQSGLERFWPAPVLLEMRHRAVFPMPLEGSVSEPGKVHQTPPALNRRQAIEISRSIYARPRSEVEAEINQFLEGRGCLDGAESGEVKLGETELAMTQEARVWHTLKRRLVGVGLSERQASGLLNSYPLERIERQLAWLPYRHAHTPASYLLAAIKGDYAPPVSLSGSYTSDGSETGAVSENHSGAYNSYRGGSEPSSATGDTGQIDTEWDDEISDGNPHGEPADVNGERGDAENL